MRNRLKPTNQKSNKRKQRLCEDMKTVYKLSYILREKRDFEPMKQKQDVVRRNTERAQELLEINITQKK